MSEPRRIPERYFAFGTTRRAQVSWIEFEVPDVSAPRRAQASFLEFEVPDITFRRAQISHIELEVPDFVLRRAQISFIELEVPDFGAPGEVRRIQTFRSSVLFHRH